MATTRSTLTASAPLQVSVVSGNAPRALVSSAAVYRSGTKPAVSEDRNEIAKRWQIEAYRYVNIIGEARYAVSLFAAMAGRAELGIGEPQALRSKATWIDAGPEVEALAELCPTVRERTKLIRDYMLHRKIAGECYLIARKKVSTDPGYIAPPLGEDGQRYDTWDLYLSATRDYVDVLDPDFDPAEQGGDPNDPIWEIVGVTELRRTGADWEVRHDNNNYLKLSSDDPIIRMWHADPENRREAWSPMRAMLGTCREIEWLTMHIFTQVRARMISAGVWFLPENMTYPPPPPDAIDGGEEAIAAMNDAERFMLSLANAGMQQLDADEVAFPSVVMVDPAAMEQIDQTKLIQFWSTIDDKAMTLRSDAIRRFALGFDMPPEQTLGSSGIAVSGTSGSAGSVNHWGEWAKEEQTIQNHIEPDLDDFVGILTTGFLRLVVPTTKMIVAYDTSGLRSKQDRSKEALELNARGVLNNKRTLMETGFDPDNDLMGEEEFKRWVLVKMIGGSPTPEQVAEAVKQLTGLFMPAETGSAPVGDQPGRHGPGKTSDIEQHGPPEGDHEHKDAPYAALVASCEGLVLRALEKAGNRLLNEGKRGKDRDRTTPPVTAHLVASVVHTYIPAEFDFSMAEVVLADLSPQDRQVKVGQMGRLCANLYNEGLPYTRENLHRGLGLY